MADRHSKEFIDGVHEFIEAAEKHKYGGFVRCPCKFCKNEKDYSSSRTIHNHLFNSTGLLKPTGAFWVTFINAPTPPPSKLP